MSKDYPRLYNLEYSVIANLQEEGHHYAYWYDVEYLLVVDYILCITPNGETFKKKLVPKLGYKFNYLNSQFEITEISEDKETVWVE